LLLFLLMDAYLDPFSKIALTLTASQLAKNLIVDAEGVGEDLSFNFFAWREDKPFVCAQMESELMKENHQRRFARCYELMKILRFRLGIESLTFVAEGYVAAEPQNKELSLAFLDPRAKVKECLTVIHCDENLQSGVPDIYLFSMPYKYAAGKKVQWGHLMEFSQNAVSTVQKYAYPSMLNSAFRRRIDEELGQTPLDPELAMEISGHGFLVQEF